MIGPWCARPRRARVGPARLKPLGGELDPLLAWLAAPRDGVVHQDGEGRFRTQRIDNTLREVVIATLIAAAEFSPGGER